MHDMQKIFEIDADTDGMASGYSFEGQMLGHLVMGVKYMDSLALELGFSAEKRIMMEHMILSHHYEPEFGSPKKPMFPEAEILHYLDIIDARMFDMEEALFKLRSYFGIKTLLLEGGSILNGAFQRAGVIDELSLVVDPVIGGEGKPLCMDSKVEEYRLVDLKNHNGILWLNYKK